MENIHRKKRLKNHQTFKYTGTLFEEKIILQLLTEALQHCPLLLYCENLKQASESIK